MSEPEDQTTRAESLPPPDLALNWRQLFDALGQIVFILDHDLRLVAINEAGIQQLGRPAAELLGRFCFEVMHQAQEPPPSCPALSLIRSSRLQPQSGEIEALGKRFWVGCAPICNQAGQLQWILHTATDITAARQREARLQGLLKAAPIGIGVLVQRRLREVNDYLCQMLGYTREELLGQSARILYPTAEDFVYVGREKYRQIRLFNRGTVETRWQRRDGSVIDILLSSTPVLPGDPEGEVIFTALNITDYKKTLAALQEREGFLSSVFASIQDGLCILDRDLRIVRFNPALEQRLAPKVPVVGKKCYEVFHGRSQPCADCPSLTTLATGQPAHKIWQNRLAESPLPQWLALYTFPWRESAKQEVTGVVVYVRDITAERQAEEAFVNLVNAAPIGIYIIQDGCFKLINDPVLVEVTGYRQEELLGRPALTLVVPEHREEVRRQARQRLKTGDRRPYEYEIITKSGARKWILESVVSSFYHGQRATLGYFMDITERKRLEGQLHQVAKMEAIGLLAGGIAHDFNNLLAAISGYSEVMMLGLSSDHPHYQFVEEIKKAAERGASLTRQLLAFSRRQIMQPEVLNPNQVLQEMKPMLSRLLEENIEVLFYLGPDLHNIKMDRSQLEQVIMNLVVNARDAMPRGGYLTIETANIYLDEAYAACHAEVTPGPYVMLTLADSGVGMDAATLSRIFEPFFTTKERGRGTGLGLASVYGIVKQNQGHITVYSELGQGTVFKIYLPRCGTAVEVKAAAIEEAVVLQGQETILVVEDDQTLRQVMVQALSRFGYRVLSAQHPDEALELGRHHPGPIHLLLTDVVLPRMNGSELAARLVVQHPELKVLFMSGYTPNVIVHQGVLDQTVAFLPKPFRIKDLLAKIRIILERQD